MGLFSGLMDPAKQQKNTDLHMNSARNAFDYAKNNMGYTVSLNSKLPCMVLSSKPKRIKNNLICYRVEIPGLLSNDLCLGIFPDENNRELQDILYGCTVASIDMFKGRRIVTVRITAELEPQLTPGKWNVRKGL